MEVGLDVVVRGGGREVVVRGGLDGGLDVVVLGGGLDVVVRGGGLEVVVRGGLLTGLDVVVLGRLELVVRGGRELVVPGREVVVGRRREPVVDVPLEPVVVLLVPETLPNTFPSVLMMTRRGVEFLLLVPSLRFLADAGAEDRGVRLSTGFTPCTTP
jgi:hypothetical protein